ncbi:Electron transfer DM13 [Gloeomargarita lithophora Alchichica-D10]|uniref:Electron transfer DM13 n=1 Tax=Gloeomargarita lithophora Alchichica-D10 TaxID=1188229 RepID=A0A1J0AD85_9CYAN|nr:DM13 domain-containing protein [Gloeomargarita lithophora]APB33881.1 Electron transfer DM13 [Gloeomargarita lithophora Alchichica-D10]
MKLTYVLGTATAVLVTGTLLAQFPSQSRPAPLISQAKMATLASGAFMKGEAPTTGMATIVEEGGRKFLQIDGAFSTKEQAPDLHVILEPLANPPRSYKAMNGFINLGKLQKFKGAQQYPIPDIVNVKNYKSVVIWCRMANATIGYAPIK